MENVKKTDNLQKITDNTAAMVEQFLANNGYHSITEIAEMGQMSRNAVIHCLLNKYGSTILQNGLRR